MIKKNIEKQERKARRHTPIPPTKKGPTKNELLKKAQKKYDRMRVDA